MTIGSAYQAMRASRPSDATSIHRVGLHGLDVGRLDAFDVQYPDPISLYQLWHMVRVGFTVPVPPLASLSLTREMVVENWTQLV